MNECLEISWDKWLSVKRLVETNDVQCKGKSLIKQDESSNTLKDVQCAMWKEKSDQAR